MDNIATHKAISKKFHLSNRTKDNLPWCSGHRYNRVHFAELLGQLHFNVGAEIGVRRANYSLTLCLKNPELKIYCIDPWSAIGDKYPQERQEEFYNLTVERMKPFKATIIRKTSMDALVDIEDRSLDFVYIDGDHHFDFVMLDIIHWSKKVRSGGIVACHDVYNGEVGIVKAVEAYTHSHNIVPWYITKELQPTAYWVNP